MVSKAPITGDEGGNLGEFKLSTELVLEMIEALRELGFDDERLKDLKSSSLVKLCNLSFFVVKNGKAMLISKGDAIIKSSLTSLF